MERKKGMLTRNRDGILQLFYGRAVLNNIYNGEWERIDDTAGILATGSLIADNYKLYRNNGGGPLTSRDMQSIGEETAIPVEFLDLKKWVIRSGDMYLMEPGNSITSRLMITDYRPSPSRKYHFDCNYMNARVFSDYEHAIRTAERLENLEVAFYVQVEEAGT